MLHGLFLVAIGLLLNPGSAGAQNLGGAIEDATEMILPDSIDGIEYFRTEKLVVDELSVFYGELQLANGLKVTGDGDFQNDLLVYGGIEVAGNAYFTGITRSDEVPGVVGMNDVGELVYIATETLLSGGGSTPSDPLACPRGPDGEIISQEARWGYQNNNIFTNPCTVNPQVGIGTHQPRLSLDVIGSGIFTGDLAIGRSTTRGGLDVQGKAYFGDDNKFVEIGCDGANAYINSQSPTGELLLNYFNNSDVKIGANGAAQGPADLYVAGNTNIGHTLRIGDYSFYNGATQHATLELGDADNFIKNTRNTGIQIAAYNNTGIWIKNNGGVGIGTQPASGVGLHIKTGENIPFWVQNSDGSQDIFKITGDQVYAHDVTVQVGNFPDYVFSEGYKLRDLSSVEKYIETHHRLPKMPGAEEVEEKGMSVAEINRLLVEKVEELTLYIIEQEKRIRELEKKSAEQ